MVEYSIYSGECDYETHPVRVDSGYFAGTAVLYRGLKVVGENDDMSMSYYLDFLHIVEDGKVVEAFSTAERRKECGNIAGDIIIDIISKSVEKAIKEAKQDEQ